MKTEDFYVRLGSSEYFVNQDFRTEEEVIKQWFNQKSEKKFFLFANIAKDEEAVSAPIAIVTTGDTCVILRDSGYLSPDTIWKLIPDNNNKLQMHKTEGSWLTAEMMYPLWKALNRANKKGFNKVLPITDTIRIFIDGDRYCQEDSKKQILHRFVPQENGKYIIKKDTQLNYSTANPTTPPHQSNEQSSPLKREREGDNLGQNKKIKTNPNVTTNNNVKRTLDFSQTEERKQEQKGIAVPLPNMRTGRLNIESIYKNKDNDKKNINDLWSKAFDFFEENNEDKDIEDKNKTKNIIEEPKEKKTENKPLFFKPKEEINRKEKITSTVDNKQISEEEEKKKNKKEKKKEDEEEKDTPSSPSPKPN